MVEGTEDAKAQTWKNPDKFQNGESSGGDTGLLIFTSSGIPLILFWLLWSFGCWVPGAAWIAD